MALLSREIRHALRRLRRAPAFSLTAILTLALGIGATTAVFTVVNAVLLRPLPYDRPDDLVALSHTLQLSGVSAVQQSDATFLLYRRASRSFSAVGGYTDAAVNLDGTSAGPEAERVAAGLLSVDVLRVLRIPPLRGRTFTDDDDRPGSARVVLLGERLWRRRYAGDPAVVGKRILIDGVSREIIGVLRGDFRFPSASTELWLPLNLDPAKVEPASFNYSAIARLAPNVSRAAATEELTRIMPRVVTDFPSPLTMSMLEQVHLRPVVTPLRDVVVGDIGRVLWVVLGTVGFVLLIACANVANLFLVRAEGRQKELAVRAALGAARGALMGQLAAEGWLLAVFGGVAGLALAVPGVRLLQALGGGIDIPRLNEVRVDGAVLAFTIGVSVLAAVMCSVVPVLRIGTMQLIGALKDLGRSATAGRDRHRARMALVVSQVALALLLLVGSGLMARSFARLRAVNPGFDASHVLTFRIAAPPTTYKTAVEVHRLYESVLADLSALPGVESVAGTSRLPLTDAGQETGAIWVEDHPTPPGSVPNVHNQIFTDQRFLKVMHIPLLEGRGFGLVDPARPRHEALVSRSFAQRYWKNESAIGKRIHPGPSDQWSTIVGIVGDVRVDGLEQPPAQLVYFPLVMQQDSQIFAPRTLAFVMRTAGDPSTLTASVRRVMQRLAPSAPMFATRPMTEIVARASARTSFTLLLLGIASAAALLLGAIGIYGVISYMVSLRTREIGVRMALGAAPGEIRRMVSRQGLTMAGVGVVIGLVAAAGLTRYLRALLFEISPTDPVTLGGVATGLLVVALAASWLPARRASRVEPAVALRSE
ncbi:MAG TPA: ABC transporter permease [Gemmatimonadaceae bacterium]|nr:ABC transporter permease [Gemmatimonadaceae bacterium]